MKPGDVIAYSADSSNMTMNFELLCSYAREDGSYFAYSNEIGIPTKTDYSAELYLGYGIVKAATGNGLVVNAHGDGRDETWNHYFPLEAKLTRTYLFDTETNKWQTVPYATLKEGDRAIIRMQGYGLWEILIYE